MYAKHTPNLLLFGLCCLLVACAPSRYVRPLAQGEKAAQVTYGGAIFKNFGLPIPTPFITVGGAYGITESTTAFANWNATSALFGTIQLDLGASHGFLKPKGWRPGLSASATANMAMDIHQGQFKLWPQIDANAYWEYGQRKHFAYFGASTWWEPRAFAHPDEPGIQMVLPGLQFGNTLAGKTIDKTIEFKWNNFSMPNRDAVIDWAGYFGHGSIGIHLGIIKRF